MNNLLLDLANLIAEQIPTLSIDVNLFVGMKPAEPEQMVSLLEYAGTGTAAFTHTSLHSVQVVVRDRLNYTAQEMSWMLYKTLVPDDQLLPLGQQVAIVSARNTPHKLLTTQAGANEWIFELGITYNNY